MKAFMDENFLLSTPTAQKLYKEYADMKKIPVIDYHCHINPREIWEDQKFENITQVWLSADHYKWRQLRTCGVDEKYITGDASDYEKFEKWAEIMPSLIGNPLYHWSHLELKYYFGYEGNLNRKTCKEVWDLTSELLKKPEFSARNLIKKSNVRLICTTDDPIDSLEYHKLIKEDKTFDVQVLPAWRPDRAMDITKPDYAEYIGKLSKVSEVEICSFATLKESLKKRLDFFEENGCSLSDHGMDYVAYEPCTDEKVLDEILRRKLSGGEVTAKEAMMFRTAFLLFMAKEYKSRNFVMQLHYGVRRNNSAVSFEKLGADTGFDCIDTYTPTEQLIAFLNACEKNDALPKTILYSLNPSDNAAIGSIIGCFQGDGVRGKIQQGSAWWFNDNLEGMKAQMISFANLSALGNFIGMLTDSRSFLSYTRHDYFRRILCNLIGDWVENGEYPEDYELLEPIVKGISYNNTVEYFGFDLKKV